MSNIETGKRNMSQNEHKKSYAVKVTWIMIALAILVAAQAVAVAVGFITVTFHGQNKDQVTVAGAYNVVCGQDDVARFNDAADYRPREDKDNYTQDIKAISALAKDVTSRSGYAEDPTCQTILFWDAIKKEDINAAQAAQDELVTLHTEGKYPNSNILIDVPLATHSFSIEEIRLKQTNQDEES